MIQRELMWPPVLVATACLACACGGGSPPTAPANGLSVAGTYAITRSWVTMGCDPATPGATAPVTGNVTQTRGALDFSIQNADGGNFTGHLMQDGSFTNGTVSAIGAGGVRYDITLEGKFTTNAFTATLTGVQHRGGGDCREVVDWQGAKTGGGPNVIG